MSAKKTDAEKELQQKVKVLLKLFASGCKTEKQIMSIQMEDPALTSLTPWNRFGHIMLKLSKRIGIKSEF